MDQWKLILWALFLTLFLPLVLWTGLFAVFGWKLFLVLFAGVGALFLFGDKIINSPLFKGVMRLLIPFAMTFRFYRALLAGKEARDKDGSSMKAWWATLRRLLREDGDESGEPEPAALPEARSPKERARAHKRAGLLQEEIPPARRIPIDSSPDLEFIATRSDERRQKAEAPPPRSGPPTEAELDQMLLELKAKMAKEKEPE